MSKYVVLSVESVNYTNRAGDEVNLSNIYYFDPAEKMESRLDKGFRLLNKNVYPDFAVSDFSELPGLYDLTFRPFRNRRGKPESKLTTLNYDKPLQISQKGNSLLVFGAKRYDYQPTEGGKVIKGVQFFAIDPMGYCNDENWVGYPLIEASVDKGDLSQFPTVPGYYDIDLEQIRGRNGDSLYKAKSVKFVVPFGVGEVANG